MFLQQYQEIKTDKQTYIKFVALIIGLIVLMYVAWYIFNFFFGTIDEESYRNDLSENIEAIKQSVEITPQEQAFLKRLSKPCTVDRDLSQFSNSSERLEYVNSLLEQCTASGGLFINEYQPIEAFDSDKARDSTSNPFNKVNN